MQSHYPFAFEREMGCTSDELRAWLPGASGGRAIEWLGDEAARIALAQGTVEWSWQTLPPRRMALVTLPRLRVSFQAEDVDEAAWQAFMRYFDLFTQRGGG